MPALVLSALLAGKAEGQAAVKSLDDIPGAAAQAEAKKMVDEVYSDLINAKSNDEKAAAARILIMRAAETDDAPAVKYMMYQTARSLAVEAGDTRTAMDAIDGLIESFADDPGSLIEMASTSLQDLSRQARSDAKHAAVAAAGLAVVERMIVAERYDDAKSLLTRLRSSATRSKRPELTSTYKAMADELRIIRAEEQRIASDLAAFAKNPNDPALSLSVGKFSALYKGDWKAGLPLLARSSDEALAAVAKMDMAGASDAKAQAAIGDLWWVLASKSNWIEQRNLTERARHWYRRALPSTVGIKRSILTKRLGPPGQVKWGDLILEPGIRTVIELDGDTVGAMPGPIAKEASWEFKKKPAGAEKTVTLNFEGYLYSPRTVEVGLLAQSSSAKMKLDVNGKPAVSGWGQSEVSVQLLKGYNQIKGSISVQIKNINNPEVNPEAQLTLTDLEGNAIPIPADQWFRDVTP